MIVFIKDNSPEIRRKLREAGFTVCICSEFEDSIWLDYHPEDEMPFDIHGVGYSDEDCDKEYSPLEIIQMRLKMNYYYDGEREFFDTVDEFLEKYERHKISSNRQCS